MSAKPYMLWIIIPTLNAQAGLSKLLTHLAADIGVQTQIIVSDGGSEDETLRLAISKSARLAVGTTGRGVQLARGARLASQTLTEVDTSTAWFLFLHADSQLSQDGLAAVHAHIGQYPERAAYFRYKADTPKFWGRIMEFWVGMRCFWWRLPYGDQGLLISQATYEEVGGYSHMALFEDVDMIDRFNRTFGRKALRPLKAAITTDVSAYATEGWWSRARRNMRLLKAYRRGVAPEILQDRYT